MVLNVQDEIINGTPKYNITPNGDGTDSIELANEVVQEGTPLNKSIFEKIENILSYNDSIGSFSEQNHLLQYQINTNTNNLQNGQRILIKQSNDVVIPNTFEIIKEKTDLGTGIWYAHSIKLSNGNIAVAGFYSNNYLEAFIYNQNMAQLYRQSALGSNVKEIRLIELNNGNIMFVGCNNDSGTARQLYYSICNNQLQEIKYQTAIPNFSASMFEISKLNDGNIIIVGNGGSYGAGQAKFAIIDQNGNIIKSATNVGSSSDFTKIEHLVLQNGNVFFLGTYKDSTYKEGWYAIIDKNGTFIKSPTKLGDNYDSNVILELSNGNILITHQQQNNTPYLSPTATIINNTGTILYEYNIGGTFVETYAVELSNTNIMLVNNSSSWKKIVIIDNQCNLIKEIDISNLFSGSAFNYKRIIYYNGNAYVFGEISNSLALIILDDDGNIVHSVSSLGTYMGKVDSTYSSIISRNDSALIVISAYSNTPYLIIKYSNFDIKLNDNKVDTILEVNKYYELVYNQSQNKLIAQEVRN